MPTIMECKCGHLVRPDTRFCSTQVCEDFCNNGKGHCTNLVSCPPQPDEEFRSSGGSWSDVSKWGKQQPIRLSNSEINASEFKIQMDDKARLEKLEKGIALIREVEFSYPEGSEERTQLYHIIASNFSVLNPWYHSYWRRLQGL